MTARRSRGPRAAAATAALALTACGAADRSGDRVVVRDSAGVRIVENVEPAWCPVDAWRIPDAPVVPIGAVEGEAHEQFFRITGILRLDDGRIVVADDGARELRFYDAAGHFLSSAGRQGAGPGEFRSIRRVGLHADSIWAYDAGLRDEDIARTLDYRNMKGEPHRNTLGETFRHVVNHGTYHRGQVVTMLRQLGATPPSTDLIRYYRERAGDAVRAG